MPTTVLIPTAEDFVWTPHGMTPEQAFDQLPLVCQILLTKPPSKQTLVLLRRYHASCVADECHGSALLITRCIETVEKRMMMAVGVQV